MRRSGGGPPFRHPGPGGAPDAIAEDTEIHFTGYGRFVSNLPHQLVAAFRATLKRRCGPPYY